MINDTLNTNATNEGDFEAFKVAMGVKSYLPYATEEWIYSNWRTIERIIKDKNCVLSHKEWREVFKNEAYWERCFGDKSLYNSLCSTQSILGAWVEDDEQKVLELITRCVHKLDEANAYRSCVWGFKAEGLLNEIKQKIDEGFSIARCRVRTYDLKIEWKRTKREKSNAIGIRDEICALIKSMMRKEDWEEEKILSSFSYLIRDSIGWKNKVSSWARENMMGVVPKLGWEQTLAIASETLMRNIAREFLRTKDYGVFGTYEHRVWNSEKHAHEIEVEDMGKIMKERTKGMVDMVRWEMSPHKEFIAKAEAFIAKVAA